MRQRLQKILSQAGIASRRASEKLIVEGKVKVNGKTVQQLGATADPGSDRITVNGRLLKKQELVYLVLNKPKGYISSLKDPHGRRTVSELIKDVNVRIYPVGRLDYNSEGLLIFTNDGEVANKLMHPSGKIKKQYLVKIQGVLAAKDIEKIRSGIRISDGKTLPAEIKEVKRNGNSWVQITLSEGKKNQIRRMFDHLNHPVLKLKRTAYAFLTLERIRTGDHRLLNEREIKKLKNLLNS